MNADTLTLIDTYTTALTWAEHAWYGALTVTACLTAWAAITLGRHAFDRIGRDFTRANQTIDDIQQSRKEERQ